MAPADAYFVSAQEVESHFQDFPEALAATSEIADRCRFDLPLGVAHMPTVPLPSGSLSATQFLRQTDLVHRSQLLHRKWLTPDPNRGTCPGYFGHPPRFLKQNNTKPSTILCFVQSDLPFAEHLMIVPAFHLIANPSGLVAALIRQFLATQYDPDDQSRLCPVSLLAQELFQFAARV